MTIDCGQNSFTWAQIVAKGPKERPDPNTGHKGSPVEYKRIGPVVRKRTGVVHVSKA